MSQEKRTVTKEVEVEEPAALVCDKCGKRAVREQIEQIQSFANFKIQFHYGSCFDGEIHHFDLCQDCYIAVFRTAGISITVTDYMLMEGSEIKGTERPVQWPKSAAEGKENR